MMPLLDVGFTQKPESHVNTGFLRGEGCQDTPPSVLKSSQSRKTSASAHKSQHLTERKANIMAPSTLIKEEYLKLQKEMKSSCKQGIETLIITHRKRRREDREYDESVHGRND